MVWLGSKRRREESTLQRKGMPAAGKKLRCDGSKWRSSIRDIDDGLEHGRGHGRREIDIALMITYKLQQ